MRDYAGIEQLLVLANIEGMNAEFIHMGLNQGKRLRRLNEIAIRQMRTLTDGSIRALGYDGGKNGLGSSGNKTDKKGHE